MQAGTDKAGSTGPAARQDPNLPQVFGRYLLVQRLSRGGMGEIFLAKHGLAGFEKLAVIKKVLPHLAADQQFISRFVDEAQVAIKLQHVNVAQVFEVGRVGDEYFLALEYIEGRDLRRTLARLDQEARRFPVDLALFVGRELANGLAYAHRRTTSDDSAMNLVHCDISPPNVLVSFEGETKVIDFGIAKSLMRRTETDPKMGFGKFGYMAPEQLIRGGVVDHRTDIYAAGVVLYELLVGQRLYEVGPEPDYRALAKKVARGEHQLPGDLDPALAPYNDLVATALKPRPEERFQTAAELRDAIQQCLVAVNPTISTDQLGSFMRQLFSDEMTAQRELHDRVAQTHLEDFEEAFHTQNTATVSFALGNLPGAAPEPERPRTRTPPRMPAQPAPSSSSSSSRRAAASDLDLADGTGALPDDLDIPPRSRRGLWLSLLLVVAAAGGIVVALFARRSDTPSASRARANPPITFEAIVEPVDDAAVTPPPAERDAAIVVAVEIDAGPRVRRTNPRDIRRDPRPDARTDSSPKPELTRAQVAAKFSATSREYEAYKAQNGMRLDREWNELASFVQFKMTSDNLDDAMRRIELFRAKLRD